MLDNVTVWRDGDKPFIYLRTRADLDEKASLCYTIELEDGRRISDTMPLEEIEIADYKTVQGVEYDIRRLILDEDIPYGYHSFSFTVTASYGIYNSIVMSLSKSPKKGL